jgi:hypothetical protein
VPANACGIRLSADSNRSHDRTVKSLELPAGPVGDLSRGRVGQEIGDLRAILCRMKLFFDMTDGRRRILTDTLRRNGPWNSIRTPR